MNSFVSEDSSVLNSVNTGTIRLLLILLNSVICVRQLDIAKDQSPRILIILYFSPNNLYLNTNTDYHRIKECLRQEDTSGDYLVQPRAQSGVSQSRCLGPCLAGF